VLTLFQTWIGSFLERGPKFKEQGVGELFDSPLPKSMAYIRDIDALQVLISNCWRQPRGTFIKGPIKDVNRTIANIYRAYAGDVRRITDIVRCSVVLDSMQDINNFMLMLKAICWVEQYEFNDAKQRVTQGENPLDFGQWSFVNWRQKLQLLILFEWCYFKLYVLGLPPQNAEHSARNVDQNLGDIAVLSLIDLRDAVKDDAAAVHADIDCLDALISACDEGYTIAGGRFDYDEAKAILETQQKACDKLKDMTRPQSKDDIHLSLIAMRCNWTKKLNELISQVHDKQIRIISLKTQQSPEEKNAFNEKNFSAAKGIKEKRESSIRNELAEVEKLQVQVCLCKFVMNELCISSVTMIVFFHLCFRCSYNNCKWKSKNLSNRQAAF
jgi:hypothetical protein